MHQRLARGRRLAGLALLAAAPFLLAACGNDAAPAATSPTPAADAGQTPQVAVIAEAFLTTMTPEDNIDSVASWQSDDGATWVFATAKSTHQLVVYDGDTGETLQTLGAQGPGSGAFDRPNGVFVIDDLLLVVERDNRRVQVFGLPDLASQGSFGEEHLVKPYGLWVDGNADGYTLYVTDDYPAGEGDALDLSALGERVKRFSMQRTADGVQGRFIDAFGDTGGQGALRVVESLWGDPSHQRLLIAEEDETYANEFKIYDLEGRFSGETFGADLFAAQAEGIALFECADGSGYWLTTEQDKGRSTFHLFDRGDLSLVGSFQGEAVANTDGIWLNQSGSREFPDGVLYAVHDDQGMVAFDWRDIASTLDVTLRCGQ